MENNIKICSTCKKVKSLNEFNKAKNKKFGVTASCTECLREYSRNHYKNNKDSYKKRIKKNKDDIKTFYNKYKKS